jgi:hypothetical protein
MRLRVCLGLVLLGLSACETLPTLVRVEIDGGSIEVKRKPDAPAPAEPPANATAGDDEAPR